LHKQVLIVRECGLETGRRQRGGGKLQEAGLIHYQHGLITIVDSQGLEAAGL
jgi:hypothetical protein